MLAADVTDTPTRLPTHERMWVSVLDVVVGDTIPNLGTVMHVEKLTDVVRIQLKWAASQSIALAHDAELWIDRLTVR